MDFARLQWDGRLLRALCRGVAGRLSTPIQTVPRKTRGLVAGTEQWIEETSYFREALLEP